MECEGEERKVYHLELLAEMLESEAETHLNEGREEKVQLGYFYCAQSTYTFTVWRLLKRDGVKTCHSKLDTFCSKLSSLCHWHIFRYSSRFYHLSALLPAFRTPSVRCDDTLCRCLIASNIPFQFYDALWLYGGWRWLLAEDLNEFSNLQSHKSSDFCVDNFDESDFFLPHECKLISTILMIRTIYLKCLESPKSLEWTWLEGAS